MALSIVFAIGLGVGYVSRRYGFCIFGALVELLTWGSGKRILAVLSNDRFEGAQGKPMKDHAVFAGLRFLL